MNKVLIGFNVVLAIAVAFLFFKKPSTGEEKTEKQESTKPASETKVFGSKKGSGELRVAFIQSDTLSKRYTLFQETETELNKLSEQVSKELQSKEQNLMATGQRLQKDFEMKTKSEQEAAMRQMQALEMNYNKFKEEKLAELDRFRNENLVKAENELKKFLEKYCTDNQIDFVLRDGMAGSIFYGNKAFDITDDVAKGLNEEYQKSKGK